MATHDTNIEQLGAHTRAYLAVGIALFILTVVTVTASLFDFRVAVAVTIGLLIAVLKGSLVALFFMHLSNERRIIYGTLILAAIFFFALLLLPLGALSDSYAADPIYVP